MSISVVIPHMPSVPGAPEALDRCVESLRGYDELIIVVNEGWGYAKAVNQGIKAARGDYIVVANNDTRVINSCLLWAMCIPDTVMVPIILPEPRDYKPRCFFCLPATVIKKVGLYDERFEGGYFEDDDYIRRLEWADVPIKLATSVFVEHLDGGGLTMKHIGEQEHFDANQARFKEKWEVQRYLGTDWCPCAWNGAPYPGCPHDIRGPEGLPGPVMS